MTWYRKKRKTTLKVLLSTWTTRGVSAVYNVVKLLWHACVISCGYFSFIKKAPSHQVEPPIQKLYIICSSLQGLWSVSMLSPSLVLKSWCSLGSHHLSPTRSQPFMWLQHIPTVALISRLVPPERLYLLTIHSKLLLALSDPDPSFCLYSGSLSPWTGKEADQSLENVNLTLQVTSLNGFSLS